MSSSNVRKRPSKPSRRAESTVDHTRTAVDWTFLLGLFTVSTVIKVLLFPAYRSTDFEVHRNWLAITYNLPLREWYYEATSEWTLDYPPFFAYFEWVLAHAVVAPICCLTGDWRMLEISEKGYDSWTTVVVHRSTVVASEVLFLTGVVKLFTSPYILPTFTPRSRRNWLISATFLNPGLIFVDHIHFQYNGFLFGIFCWSVAFILDGRDLLGGALFAALLNFKHINLYLAPAYFVFLLRHYCFTANGGGSLVSLLASFNVRNFLALSTTVASVFLLAWAPFALSTPSTPLFHVLQLFSRLFPFKRGLVHAYWAPNAWALYVFADRVLSFARRTLGGDVDMEAVRSATRGIVEDVKFGVLTDVRPGATVLFTVLGMLPSLVHLWSRSAPTPSSSPAAKSTLVAQIAFLESIVSCGFSSYMFGWHVHEKAILMVTIPFLLLAALEPRYSQLVRPMNVVSYYTLFPLLFRPQEMLVKYVVLGLYLVLTDDLFVGSPEVSISSLYLYMFIPVASFVELLPLFLPSWKFYH